MVDIHSPIECKLSSFQISENGMILNNISRYTFFFLVFFCEWEKQKEKKIYMLINGLTLTFNNWQILIKLKKLYNHGFIAFWKTIKRTYKLTKYMIYNFMDDFEIKFKYICIQWPPINKNNSTEVPFRYILPKNLKQAFQWNKNEYQKKKKTISMFSIPKFLNVQYKSDSIIPIFRPFQKFHLQDWSEKPTRSKIKT